MIAFFVFVLGLFFRVYRLPELLAFYIDQGDDALSIYKIWHDHSVLLLGPMTRWVDVYLGPLYYYIQAPFYALGKGNPVYPAVVIAVISSLGSLLLYFLGKKFYSRLAGLLALTLSSFSFFLIEKTGRWLSHPPLLLLISPVFTYLLWKKRWILIFFLLGVVFQLEAANAFFVLPVILALWFSKSYRPSLKTAFLSILAFTVNFIPQLIYDFSSGFSLSRNTYDYLVGEGTLLLPTVAILSGRLVFMADFFRSVFFPDNFKLLFVLFLISAIYGFYCFYRDSKDKSAAKTLLIMMVPLLLTLFYRGNRFDLYQVHMQYIFLSVPAALLTLAIGLSKLAERLWGKWLTILLVLAFLVFNLNNTYAYLAQKTDTANPLVLKNQLDALAFIDAEGQGEAYDLFFYNNGFLTYGYNYLYLWQEGVFCEIGQCLSDGSKISFLLYETRAFTTEYTATPLDVWLEEKNQNTSLVLSRDFGLIRVEKRLKNP